MTQEYCICTYKQLKEKTGLPDSAIMHNRRCPQFWKDKEEAKLLKVDEFHTT